MEIRLFTILLGRLAGLTTDYQMLEVRTRLLRSIAFSNSLDFGLEGRPLDRPSPRVIYQYASLSYVSCPCGDHDRVAGPQSLSVVGVADALVCGFSCY